ncbi:hypothetical protein Plo01_35980 [Planobispora longispora]|uniref:Uncharacterized protein n=1 Tax=Planobispora longispora TaxID=28887 RepID=A0A8J3RP71_9ACTN|nr:hypothetical protein GCM10020093_063550 [Planobispora longispora]GIH77169.1 hypothetical protein Plo01_35980 [Planobispora longispora]
MAITGVQNVTNVRGSGVQFINTENSGNNRIISPQQTVNVGNCWVPWARNENELIGHSLLIIDTTTDQVLWYIWQRWAPDGDFVRASQKGWEDPGTPIPGESTPGHSINLWIAENEIRADRV